MNKQKWNTEPREYTRDAVLDLTSIPENVSFEELITLEPCKSSNAVRTVHNITPSFRNTFIAHFPQIIRLNGPNSAMKLSAFLLF